MDYIYHNMDYQIASKSDKGRKKENYERNGDCCGWIDELGTIVLALADGVGSCADDARASNTTCDLFLEKCRTAQKENTALTEEKLSQFCCEIDPILAVDHDMSCFCAVVWHYDTQQMIWLHIGDTRIYKYNRESGLAQITEDDHGKAVNVKINGKLYTDHGALVAAKPISNAIGDQNCNFHTGTFEFNPGDSIILCSDGMYNSSSFSKDVESLLNEADLKARINKITSTDDDDASLLILRRDITINPEVSLQELISGFDDYQKIFPINALIDRFSTELETLLSTKFKVEDAAKIVAFMKEKQLYPNKEGIDRIFTMAYEKLSRMPEGEEKQVFNAVCSDLKEMLRVIFRS